MLLLRICTGVVCLAAAVAAQETQKKPAEIVAQAVELEVNGRMADAESLMKKMLAEAKEPHTAALALNELALIYRAHERPDQSEKCYRRALNLLKGETGQGRELFARVTLNLAALYVELGRIGDVRKLKVDEHVAFLTSPISVNQMKNLSASMHYYHGELDRAESIYHEVLAFLRSRTEENTDIEVATTLNNLALISMKKQQYDVAVKRMQEAADVLGRSVSPNYPALAKVIGNLGYAQFLAKDYKTAAVTLQDSVNKLAMVTAPDDKLLNANRKTLAEALAKAGRRDEAKEVKKAIRDSPPTLPQMTVDVTELSFRGKRD